MKKTFVITVSILSCIIIILGIFLFSASNNLTTTNANLENIYQRSFYDLVDNVNNMEVDVSKLMVSNDSVSQQKLLTSIKQKSSDAENDLSLLPVNSNLLQNTTRFMNQLNGYCTSLISFNDGKIESTDFEMIEKVYNGISTIKEELNKLMDKIMSGYKISENIEGEEINNLTSNLVNLSNDTVEYPSLIYDGPFSESISQKVIKGLGSNDISENDAENLITKLFDNKITNLNYLGETKGKFETFDFGVNTEDGKNYYIQITKKGGFLLTMNSNAISSIQDDEIQNNSVQNNKNEIENNNKDTSEEKTTSDNNAILTKDNEDKVEVSESEDKIMIDENSDKNNGITKNAQSVAIEFSKKLGIDNMQCVWSASSQDISYVNLAPVVDNVIMYPDLIKAKIDLNSDSVIGWEASSYAYNHTEREDLIPQLTETEAKELVSKNLKIDSQKLCVIPLDYLGETLAYEFAGKYNNFNYYLYIDAYTGNQVRVLRVIQTDEGELIL